MNSSVKPLHPPVDGDVIAADAALGEQFLRRVALADGGQRAR
jgi:hypothetical protein